VLRYLSSIVWPLGLTPDPPISPGNYWWAWLLINVACLLLYRRSIWFVAGIILLLPSSSIFPASELSADRRMYLPMVAFSTGIGILLQRWKIAPVMLAAILIPLSFARTRMWDSDETLWTDALRKNSRSVRARLRLGSVALLEEARKLEPDNPQVATELGRVYLQSGRPEQALAEFGRALAFLPNSPEALSNRGVALLLLKQLDAARQDFERALKAEPCFWDARYNLKRMGADTTSPPHCRYTPAQEEMLNKLK
jgi:tetratricopeptide (TPR) repeat protein